MKDENIKKDGNNNVFQGKTYRITILTDRLIRFEYNKEGFFEDGKTQLVVNRSFLKPTIQVKEDNQYLMITSKYFKLEYIKEKPIVINKKLPSGDLKVTLLNTDKMWNPGNPEVRNFMGSAVSVEELPNTISITKGLYSTDGFVTIDDSKSLLMKENGSFEERPAVTLDLYLFCYIKDFGLCLKDYFELTGKPPLLPRYAFGNWWSKNYEYTDESLYHLFTKFEKNEIPISVLLLDHDWHRRLVDNKSLDSGFSFNRTLFKDPKDFVYRMHNKGVRVGLIVNPTEGIYPDEEMYFKFATYLNQVEQKPIPFNAFQSKFIEGYFKIVLANIESTGIDFFWNDYKVKNDLQSLFLLNHYHFLFSQKGEEKRSMLLSRNSLTAGHRYGVLYSGRTPIDFNVLKELPVFNSMASNIGLSWWSHDIGGFKGGQEDGELFLRYVQLGTFSPIFRIHVDRGHYYKREPWRWDIRTFEIVRNYMQLRHRLIPYIYSENYKYHKSGLPFIQPLYYKDPAIFDEPRFKNEYYFGSELLVSPLAEKKDLDMNRVIHKFFLPDGMWYDFNTGKKFPGGRNYVSFFKDENYPVFARSGSIIPLANDEVSNDPKLPKNFEIHIFPGKSNTFKLYEDDGVSNLYKQGYFLSTSIDYNYQVNNYTVIIRALEGKSGIVPKLRNYKIRFRNTKYTEEVDVYTNDSKLTPETYVDDNDFVIEVKDVSTIQQLTINCKGKAIEIDAVRLINEEVDLIIDDLPILTSQKELIASVIYSDLPVDKKRIAMRKLKKKGIEIRFIRMFIRLLEYIGQI